VGDVLSTEQAAAITGLHVETVRSYLREGRIPYRRVGRMYLIDSTDLKRWMAVPRKPGRPPRKDRTR
jgi:excisionase family DNA binding protein